jgi:hypothetical protein
MYIADGNTVYGSQFPQIMTSMLTLGVTHYRDGLTQYAQPFQYQNAEILGKAGIKAYWLMDFNNSAANINSAYANAPDATAGFEGPNEDDAENGALASGFHAVASKYGSCDSRYGRNAHHRAFLHTSVFIRSARQSQFVNQFRQHS